MTVIANAVSGTRIGTTTQPLVWTEVGPGLWVAKCGADFAGLIEKLWGAGYRATDGRGSVIGEFSSITSAKARVR